MSLADKVWKGSRITGLETLVVDRIATATGLAPWQAFVQLDEVLEQLVVDADDRLLFQARYPVAH